MIINHDFFHLRASAKASADLCEKPKNKNLTDSTLQNHKTMKIVQFSKYLLVIMSAFFMASCEDDPTHPPINEINEDAVMTIADIRDHYNGEPVEFTGDAMLFATVVMDEHTGNIYRSLIVQDETGGIDLRLATPSQFSIGDSLRISLDGAVLDAFEQMLQLDNIDPNEAIVRQATEKYMEPQTVEIPDIKPEMQAQLIKLEDVQFAMQDVGETYAYPDEQMAASRVLMDEDGNSIEVRTSGYADFAGEQTPEGSGSVIAVVSQYRDFMQLYIRSTDEVELDNDRFPPPGEDADLITIAEIRQMFHDGETSLPDNSRLEGVIISDREYENHPGQNAYLMDENGDGIALRFQNWHSLNYGHEVRVIVSNMTIALFQGLLQIEDIPTGNAHSLGEGEVPEPTLVTIGELNDNFDQYESTLIHIEDVSVPSANSYAGNIQVSDGTGNINIYTYNWADFADDPVEGGIYNITAIASFHFNPQLLLRNLDDMEYVGEDDDNGEDVDPVTTIDEDFQGYDDFEPIDANGWTSIAEVGERKWRCNVHQGSHYAQATAFNSTDDHNIMWMITPPVDLDASTAPVFEFESAQAHFTHDGFSVYIATDFDGSDVQNATWESLPATLVGEDDDWHEWIPSGLIDLSGYSGIVHIAWRYEGNEPAGETGTFRVNNVQLYDAAK